MKGDIEQLEQRYGRGFQIVLTVDHKTKLKLYDLFRKLDSDTWTLPIEFEVEP